MVDPIDSFPRDLAWNDQYAGFQPTGLSLRLPDKELRWTR